MIKIFITIFTVFFTTCSLFAQVEPPSKRLDHGGFGSFDMSIMSLNNKTAVYTGGGGGFIIRDFRIGVFFSGLTNTYSQRDTSNVTFKLGYSQGGLWLSYPFYTKKDYHPIIEVKMHYGNMRLINTNWHVRDNASFYGFSAAFGLEYKLGEVFFVAGGIKYCHSYLLKTMEDLFDNDYFNSIGMYISFRLGTFNY